MLRPVGSRVPAPALGTASCLPWEKNYDTWHMGSGTQALSAAVLLAIGRSGLTNSAPEVILPAYGCPDLVAAVVAQGARPVLVDLMPGRPFMDTEQVSAAFSDATVAIIAAGFLGVPEQLDALASLCRDRNIWLIEDSAQCFPPDCAREPNADCAVLSFGRGKPINLMGGGALLVREDHRTGAAERLLTLPVEPVSIDWKWHARRCIFNFLLGRLGYGLLRRVPFLGLGATVYKPLVSIKRVTLPGGLLGAGIRAAEQRPNVVLEYARQLGFLEARGWKLFMGNEAAEGDRVGGVTLRYGLLALDRESRDKAIDALTAKGIGANAFYGYKLPDIAGVSACLDGLREGYPNAEFFAARLVTLPSHEDVSEKDLAIIAATLDKVTAQHKK
ncbi:MULTISPECIES: DegT/DnrJ/EryC1/StrS family aminotransferase [Marinobacter]|uniref:DegT/DnrJ/EryC1/StrS family aminotransferase n=1 Tax=Marinobacter TaxID=2742 RepID=UPI001786ADD5|nr:MULTISPECIES: DegT/DnrJ/EryC1/StrS family aminotransferase [Marinobacter]MBL3556722.1 DegT/DnrJ/EryC1/StrS aminotransferase family protein [Marinobacter sp. JB05H06]